MIKKSQNKAAKRGRKKQEQEVKTSGSKNGFVICPNCSRETLATSIYNCKVCGKEWCGNCASLDNVCSRCERPV